MKRIFRRNLFRARKRALFSPRLFAIFVLLFGIARAHSAEILVFAAASLTDALRQIANSYESRSPDKIFFNFAASSTLARQIEEGAPADVFFSADEAKMDALENRGLIVNQTRTNLLSNALVIITPDKNAVKIQSPPDLTNAVVKRIALADPRAVPAGIYSKTFLQRQKLWNIVESKIVPTENVRGALAAVESGNAEAGMVYKTDAAISKKVRVAYEVPVDDAPKILYPAAIVKDSKQIEAARKFLQYLESDDARKIFKKFGFIALD